MSQSARLQTLLGLSWILASLVGCQAAPPTPPTPTPLPPTATAAPATVTPPLPTATLVPAAPPTPLPPVTHIHTIQGAGHVSPLSFKIVENVPGIVTVKRSTGFYLQDPEPDADDATSEAIFVLTGTPPTVSVGDRVSVRGLVTEARPGGEGTANLSLTQLESPRVTILSRGNPLPTPVVLGQGGRRPPPQIIEDDAGGDVERGGVFDPAEDGLDFYESLESMLVQVKDAVVVGPRNRFGEMAVLADDGAGAGLRTGRGGIVIRPTDFNPERVFLDDEILLGMGLRTPSVNVGDHLPGPLVGLLDYSFGNFKLQLTAEPAVVPGNLPAGVAQPPSPDQISAASFNVENLDPTDVGRFEALAAAIVGNLRSPDLISVEEIQDNNGAFNDSVVDASRTYNLLVEAIRAAGGPTYSARQIDPVDDQDGGEPGGNIRVGFLFRADRGLAFVDRPGGTATTAVGLENGPGGLHLTVSPGRIEPTHPAFQNSRKPLVGEFQVGDHTLFVIGAHLISKGGDHPLMGRFQPPVLSSEPTRVQQAQVVAQFVQRVLAADADANLLLLGDLNDFQFAAPLQVLKAAGLQVLAETLPENERYSYVYEGNSEALDHVLVSAHLAQVAAPQFEYVHLNAEYAEHLSDHDPALVRLTLPRPVTQVLPAPPALPTLPPVPTIPWSQARQYLGQTVRAEGVIVTTRNTGKVVYLNFSRAFQTDLKIVIFPPEAARFPQPPERMFDGRTVRVTGKVEEYQGAPEIIVRDPRQIEVLK